MGSKINLKTSSKFKPAIMFIASFALILGNVIFAMPEFLGQSAYALEGPDTTIEKIGDLSNGTAIFKWSSINGIGSENSQLNGSYNYYTNGAYLRFQVKKDGVTMKFADVFETGAAINDTEGGMTLQTNAGEIIGNINDMDGSNRERADWGIAGLEGFATNLTNTGNNLYYGLIQNSLYGTKTVGFSAGDERIVNMKLNQKSDLDGSYVITIEALQQGNPEVKSTLSYTLDTPNSAGDLETAILRESMLCQADYVDYSAVTTALALPETTNAEIVAKTIAINNAINALVFAGLADLTTAKAKESQLDSADYVDYSAVTTALALPETTNAETVAKTTAINNAINALVFADGATLSINTVVSGDGSTKTGKIEKATESTAIYSGIVTKVNIPEGLIITGPSDWDGSFSLPTATTTEISRQGFNTNVTSAITIGSNNKDLTFDKGVRIIFTGQADKFAGWKNHAGIFGGITAICTADNQDAGNALSAGADCKMNVGSDLVIWTRHFTTFMTYSQELIATNNVQPATVAKTASDIEIAQQQQETLGAQTVKDTKATDKTADKVAEVANVSTEWNIFGLAWYWWLLAIVAAVSARRVYVSFNNSRSNKNSK